MILHRESLRNKTPGRAGDDEKKIPREARNDKTKSYMTKDAGQWPASFIFYRCLKSISSSQLLPVEVDMHLCRRF